MVEIVGWSRRLLLRHSGLHQEDHLPLAKWRVNPCSSVRAIWLLLQRGSRLQYQHACQELVLSQCDWSSASCLNDDPFVLDNYISVLSHALLVFFASVREIRLYSLSWDWEWVVILL